MIFRLFRLAMADLLASLEVGMTRTVGATQRLRSQVERIDEYMATRRQQEFAFPLQVRGHLLQIMQSLSYALMRLAFTKNSSIRRDNLNHRSLWVCT